MAGEVALFGPNTWNGGEQKTALSRRCWLPAR